jgi:hypothetical protein
MRRATLPFPNRGYQTATPDGVLGVEPEAETRMAGTKLSRRLGRSLV